MAHFLTFLCIFFSTSLHAKDFGIVGHTFPIREQNILDYIKERLSIATKGENEIFARIVREKSDAVKEPTALLLPNALKYRSYLYDPTITANTTIKDSDGNVIVAKGSTYNPLDYFTLNNDLLFFDASQEEQLAWAQKRQGTWILTKGKPIELEEKNGFPVYFDQLGTLTKKFNIHAIPARVSQEGRFLKVEEIHLGGSSQ